MNLTALRTFRFENRNYRRGMAVEMSAARAKEHIARGLVSSGDKQADASGGEDLLKLKKEELVDLANKEGVAVEDADTKAVLVEKIETARKAQ